MRILVTGASGFSGSYLASALALRGHETVGLYRRKTAFLERVAHASGITLICGDLARLEELPDAFDAVIHAAATSPGQGVSDAEIRRDNFDGTRATIEAALRWNCRCFVFLSSLSLYGRVSGPVLDESTPIVEPDVYGATKRDCEAQLAASSARLPSLALRLPGVIGPGAHRNWLSGVAAKLQASQPVRAFHLDSPFNNATHIADIADLIAAAIEKEWQGFDAAVLGAAGTISVRAAIERLAAALGVRAVIEPVAAAKDSFILSSAHAIARWGYRPMEIGAMIDRYAQELRAEPAAT